MIFSWYRQKINEFGFVRASGALWRIAWNRAYVKSANALLPKQIECPCCGWTGRRLFDYVEIGYTAKNTACPRCDSHARHRTFFLWLRDRYRIDQRTGAAVIFAPERALVPLWESARSLATVKLDIEPSRGVDVIADIGHLPFADEAAQIVWCHHVLDQVPDDNQALRELRRVLDANRGELIISVGETTTAATREFGYSNQAFAGNRRVYGSDFPERLIAAGFDVTRVRTEFTPAEQRRYGLKNDPFYICGRKESYSNDSAVAEL